jgi:hypothetical protein
MWLIMRIVITARIFEKDVPSPFQALVIQLQGSPRYYNNAKTWVKQPITKAGTVTLPK